MTNQKQKNQKCSHAMGNVCVRRRLVVATFRRYWLGEVGGRGGIWALQLKNVIAAPDGLGNIFIYFD